MGLRIPQARSPFFGQCCPSIMGCQYHQYLHVGSPFFGTALSTYALPDQLFTAASSDTLCKNVVSDHSDFSIARAAPSRNIEIKRVPSKARTNDCSSADSMGDGTF